MTDRPTPAQLVAYLRDARARTLELVDGLTPEQLMGAKLATVNPLRWEIGHAAYFHELWTLRHLEGLEPGLSDADRLFNSMTIRHDDRWDLPLPSMEQTRDYMAGILERQIERIDRGPLDDRAVYLYLYAVFHEDMHTEAFTYARQTLGYPAPRLAGAADADPGREAGPLPGDAEVPGGTFMLGAMPDAGFAFDNEKWAHPVELEPFRIARAPVTNAELAEFVADGGYERRELWSAEGWAWRESAGLRAPRYWRRDAAGGWCARAFDRAPRLRPHAAAIHVSWYEANAFCAWAGRRLPTEAEWEAAAAAEPGVDGARLSGVKRRYPWGDSPPAPDRANLDGRAGGVIDVAARPAGDSAVGCRQMIGNVWEWTSDTFRPYPGFLPDMYVDYSLPLFGTTKVLRGGAWPTRGRMLRNTWRNYYGPDRNDVFAGFRTCAI